MSKQHSVFQLIVLFLLVLCTGLSGCNRLTQYSISEDRINQSLEKQNPFTRTVNLSGFANAQLTVTHLISQIGREQPDKLTLAGTATVTLTSLLGTQQAEVQLKLKARPVFNAQRKAIYLQDLELVSVDGQTSNINVLFTTLTPLLNQSLQLFFTDRPVYVLRTDRNTAEALAAKFAHRLEVKPGELIIVFM